MTAETEGVAQGSTYLTLLCLVEGEVEVVVDFLVLVIFLMVDGRGNDVVLHGQDGSHSLYGTGGTEQVTGHTLRRRDVELIGSLTKHILDGLGLRDVAYVSGCAVNIDVIDILRFQTGILQGTLHHEFGTQSLGMRSRDVISVGTHTGTHHFGIDLGTASLGMLQLFENQTARTFAHDETVAAGAEGAAGLFGFVITGGERLHGIETTHACGANGSLGTTGNDGVGLAQTDQVESIGQGIAGRSTGRSRDIVRTVEART